MKRTLLLSASRVVLLGALAALAVSVKGAHHRASISSPDSKPWMSTSLAPERRAELLVHAMTLDEKILEIHMMNTKEHPREVPAIERLGIPALKITNGPLGAGPGDSLHSQPATAFPSALALAASWDLSFAEQFGRVAAGEVADRGEDVIESPAVNITRVPQNGRNFEYFGEDPYLAAQMGVAETRGFQSQGVIAEVKHYAANNQEAGRKTINEIIDERTLREIYLPAFEAVVKKGEAGAVMCAYPSVNGQFGCENVHLLKDILRGEWGFQGFVQSDYTATHSTIPAALAGLDLEMKHDEYYDAGMKAAIQNGKLTESAADSMLIRRFRQMFRFGLFDHTRQVKALPGEQDGEVARQIAEQSAVLLKNANGELPLDAKALHSIALIGPYAGEAHTGGGGSSAVTPLYTITPLDGIKKEVGTRVKVTYTDGSDPDSAANIAKSAEVAILMAGNKDREGQDRANLSLPGDQDKLISTVAAANPHTVVVLKTGGPVLMPWLNQVPAVLEAWYPGEEDGNAVADLLFGSVDPSGKLPMTFPKSEGETPAHTPQQYPGVNGTVAYSEGLQVGYRWYDKQNIAPLFSFGFGLTYTAFTIKDLTLPREVSPGEPLRAEVEITNTGKRDGADVIQVYIASPSAAGEPPKQLKGFAKVFLTVGESKHVTVTLDPRAFSIWSTDSKRWSPVPGNYAVLVGDSSRDLQLRRTVTVDR